MREVWDRACDYWWLLVAPAVLVAFLLAAYLWNPVETIEVEVVIPAARSVGLAEGRCPDGWSHSHIQGHIVVETCYKAPWSVTLFPNNIRKANFGVNTLGGENAPTVACKDIPNWPDSWCLE